MANIHIRTALDYIRRSPFQALAAIFVLTITFFVITVLSVLVYGSGQALRYFETRPQVIAFIKDDATLEQIDALQDSLDGDPRIKEVTFISKEEALEIYKEATADNPLLSELVSPTIFPASLEFSLSDLSHAQSLIDEVSQAEIVDSVGFTASLGGEDSLGDVVSRLRAITWYLRIGGGAFATLLAGTSFMVLIIIIGMRMTVRRGEIEILDLIGATSGFIKSPIIIEAIVYALVGVLTGWLLAFLLVLYTAPSLISYFGEIPVIPRDTLQLVTLFGVMLSVEILVGLILALAGSMLAVSRVKRLR